MSNYSEKLQKLRSRRAAPTTFRAYDSATAMLKAESYAPRVESFETKGNGDATRYALGCIAEVPPEYTQISVRDGDRIAAQMKAQTEWPVMPRLQGSVPLNIHIYTSSDVDLLVLCDWFVSVSLPVQLPSTYTFSSPPISPLDELKKLRAFCETYLARKYPAADVDVSGSKSIAVSGGSLARKVDVVPANWIDTLDYQRTKLEIYRDVMIFDKRDNKTISNSPFLHMQRVNEKDQATQGYAKKAIRLLKCLCRDSDVQIALSSYDIASLICHMASTDLVVSEYFPLQLLDRVEAFLRQLEQQPDYARTLVTPDGSRRIFDKEEKLRSLHRLREELTQAIDNIGAEYNTAVRTTFDRSHASAIARKAINEAFIF